MIFCLCSLTIEHKLYCDADYYSADCSVYCVANNTDAGGHYTCDPITGDITCRAGKSIFTRCLDGALLLPVNFSG